MAIYPPTIYVADTGTAKGRGVFANRPFKAGSIVEVCPIVLVPTGGPCPYELDLLLFNWGKLGGASGMEALALGYGSLYNDSNPANMRYAAHILDMTMHFIAHRHIAEGEELTINYSAIGGGATSADNDWFRRKQVRRIP